MFFSAHELRQLCYQRVFTCQWRQTWFQFNRGSWRPPAGHEQKSVRSWTGRLLGKKKKKVHYVTALQKVNCIKLGSFHNIFHHSFFFLIVFVQVKKNVQVLFFFSLFFKKRKNNVFFFFFSSEKKSEAFVFSAPQYDRHLTHSVGVGISQKHYQSASSHTLLLI